MSEPDVRENSASAPPASLSAAAESEIRDRFADAIAPADTDSTFLHRFLGIELKQDGGDVTALTFRPNPAFRNRHGNVHGGIIALLFDIVMGNHHRAHGGGNSATIELKVQYLRPLRSGPYRVEARFLRQGRRISFVEGRMTDEAGDLVAAATGTWHRREG